MNNMKYEITVDNTVSFIVTANRIKKGVGFNPVLNETVQKLYKEFVTINKTNTTCGIGYSDLNGFNIQIYEVF